MGTNKDKKKEYVNKLAKCQSIVAKLLKNLTPNVILNLSQDLHTKKNHLDLP